MNENGCNMAIFGRMFMKFSLMGRTSELGMFYAILGSFYSFFSWEGADIRPQIRLRKIPVFFWSTFEDMQQTLN